MKFATLPNGEPDGCLHLVSRDLRRCAPAGAAKTLQQALESWEALEPALQAEYDALNQSGGEVFDATRALAPLPRAWQWLDGSAFDSHGELMDKVFGMNKPKPEKPLMYQGVSDRFYAPCAEIPFVSTEDGIDFEGEFGIITDATPMNASKAEAARHIRLVVQINDWSLRKLAPIEMKTGFGWIQAKPPCGMAPVAVTPDELGAHWRDARVDLALQVRWNGKAFGAGAVAHAYERLGGAVEWFGKPHPAIYEEALRRLGEVERTRVLAVGDSPAHDILGAARAGLASCLVRTGVHDNESEAELIARCEAAGAMPDALLPRFGF